MKAFRFLTSDAGAGMVLAAAALLAVILANSPLESAYAAATGASLAVPGLGTHSLADWIKEGPMAVFFFAVGLEIKHELRHGELAHWRRAMLPVAGALGGMAGPALVYLAINLAAGGHHAGWPIPVATDIAFALAALAVALPKANPSLRLFLLTLAVVDDLGAIALIALLFSHGATGTPLLAAAVVLGLAGLLGRWPRAPAWMFAVLLLAVIALTMKAHVSTSLAGVAMAMMIPDSRLVPYQRALAPWMALLVLPLFALTAAGVPLSGMGATVATPVSLGVITGLVLGKPLGVLGGAMLARGLGLAARPHGLLWGDIAAIALLCGVGFTMSLYLAALAFPTDAVMHAQAKAGVLAGSVIAAGLGMVALRLRTRLRPNVP